MTVETTQEIPLWWRSYVWSLLCMEAIYMHRGMPVAGKWGEA